MICNLKEISMYNHFLWKKGLFSCDIIKSNVQNFPNKVFKILKTFCSKIIIIFVDFCFTVCKSILSFPKFLYILYRKRR